MMKSIVKIFLIGISALIVTTPVIASDDNQNDNYSINEKYEYPIKAGTQEWSKLNTTDEMIQVTQIPRDYLKKMTTEALVESVADYPLLGNIFVYNSRDEALTMIAKQFNGMEELLAREDGVSKLMDYYYNLKNSKLNDEKSLELEWILTTNKALKGLSDNDINKLSKKTDKVTISKNTRGKCSIRTQKGSCVDTVATNSLTSSQIKTINANMATSYPQAKRLRDASANYNCHSYAYYSESANNNWINNPNPYFSDGSFNQVFYKGNRVRARYVVANHSAIFMNASTVKSKWGTAGVYQHTYNYGPYSTAGLTTFMRYDLK